MTKCKYCHEVIELSGSGKWVETQTRSMLPEICDAPSRFYHEPAEQMEDHVARLETALEALTKRFEEHLTGQEG